MSDQVAAGEDRKKLVDKYGTYGFVGGAGFGMLAGVVVAGPHFHEWSAVTTWLVIFGTAVGLGVFGNVAVALAYGSAISGFSGAPFFGAGHHGGDGGHHGGGDGGHGAVSTVDMAAAMVAMGRLLD